MLPVIYHRRAVGTVLRRGPRVPLGMLWLWQLKRCTFTCQRRSPRFLKWTTSLFFPSCFQSAGLFLAHIFSLSFSHLFISLSSFINNTKYQDLSKLSIIKYQMYFKIVYWDWLVALIISKVKCILLLFFFIFLESYEKLWGLDRDGRWTNSELQD